MESAKLSRAIHQSSLLSSFPAHRAHRRFRDPLLSPPRPLSTSSQALGADRPATFFLLTPPLSIPGLFPAAAFAFVLSLGDFLAPLLVGAPSATMIANIVPSLFGAAYDWPLGAAISV